MVSIAETNVPERLDTICRDDVEVAIWRRTLAASLCDWLDGLPADKLPSIRATVTASEIGSAVDAVCDRYGTPNGFHRRLWIDDIAGLTARFAEIMQLQDVDFRLDVINTDACARFHADNVRARLICTYRGPGTEYGPARPDSGSDPLRATILAGGFSRHRLVSGGAAGDCSPLASHFRNGSNPSRISRRSAAIR